MLAVSHNKLCIGEIKKEPFGSFFPVLFQNKQQRHFEASLCGYAVQTVLLKTEALASV